MTSLAAMLGKPGAMVQCDDDPEAVFDLLCEKGWSDGLPVIPPTPERVERMLAYCDRDLDQPVIKIPPRFGAATPVRIAANAVMAGCRPEYFPIVVAAVQARTGAMLVPVDSEHSAMFQLMEGVDRARVVRGVLWTALVLLIVFGAYAWQARDRSDRVQYRTEPAQRGNLVVTVTATGSLAPTNQVDVGIEISGTVRAVEAEVGAVAGVRHRANLTLGDYLLAAMYETASPTVLRFLTSESGIFTPHLSSAAMTTSTIDSESMSRSSTKDLSGWTSSTGTPATSLTMTARPSRISWLISFLSVVSCRTRCDAVPFGFVRSCWVREA